MKKLLCVVVSLAAAWLVCDAKDWEQETLGEGDSESTGLQLCRCCVSILTEEFETVALFAIDSRSRC